MASLHVELVSPPSASFPDTHLQVPHFPRNPASSSSSFSHDGDDDNAEQVGRDVKEFLHREGIHSTTVQLEYHLNRR